MKPEVFRLSAAIRWMITVTLGAMAGITLALLLGLLQNKNGVPVEWSVRIGLPVFIGFPCLFAIFWVWRERILTDAQGLRWRRVWRNSSAGWEEIDDYFLTLSSQGSRVFVVKFFDGRTLKFNRDFSEWSRLQKIISERAVNAKAKGWLMRGKEGNVTGKVVAVYTEKRYRSQIIAILVIISLFSAMFIALPFAPDKNGVRDNSWGPTIVFLPILFTLAFLGISAIRRTKKHIGERVEADEKGFLSVSSGGAKRYVRWSEVIAISILSLRNIKDGKPMGWLLETKEGPVTFLVEMENAASLLSLTRQCVPQAFVVTEAPRFRDALISTEKTNGKRIFHYRTRSNRFYLGIVLSLTALPLWAAIYVLKTEIE